MLLSEFFEENKRVALAFSGGVDSAYLLYAAKKYGAQVKAYYVKTDFQPQFELDDAKRLAKELDVAMKVIEMDVLEDEKIAQNPKDRCYYCKKKIFSSILKCARADGYDLLIDGNNASDDVTDRPGMKAVAELGVRSPLRECALTKTEIRKLSKEAGLFTHDKPAYACLATRIPSGEEITKKKLSRTEAAENFLSDLGFRDFRVRTYNNGAKIQLKKEQITLLTDMWQEIYNELIKVYDFVVVDMEVRK